MSLSAKLGFSSGITLLLLAAVMYIYHSTVTDVSGTFNDLLSREVEIANYVGEVESLMLQCRRNEKDFLLRKDLKYLEHLVQPAKL